MESSGAPRRSREDPLDSASFQADLQGPANAPLHNLWCWQQDDIIGDAEQIHLTNMEASAVELRARSKELHCNGEHICQLDLRGIADYRSSMIGFATLDNLQCWQDN